MELREATHEDIDRLTELWYSLAAAMEPYSPLNELVYDSPEAVPADGFEELLAADGTDVYLVTVDAEVAGFVVLREDTHPSRRYDHRLDIVDLLVVEEHRGCGVGSAVIDRVGSMARDRGCDHLTVSCEWANDGARRFYAANGFEEKQVTFARSLE